MSLSISSKGWVGVVAAIEWIEKITKASEAAIATSGPRTPQKNTSGSGERMCLGYRTKDYGSVP